MKEIISFMHYYYFNWGGRVIGIGAVHFILLFPPLVQDIFNTLLFITLLYTIYKIANRAQKNNAVLLLFVLLLLFYIPPSFISSAIWLTGSGVFLLTGTLTVLFIYQYYRYYNDYYNGASCQNAGLLRSVLFFFFGALAAWSNENTGPILVLLTVVYTIFIYSREKQKIPKWILFGLIGTLVGCSLMAFAPGNVSRAALEGHESLFSSPALILKRLPTIYIYYRACLMGLIGIFLLALLANCFFPKDKHNQKSIIIQALLFFLAGNIALWITILAPTFPPRALFSLIVLMIIGTGILFQNIDFSFLMSRSIALVLFAALLVYSIQEYSLYIQSLRFLDNQLVERQQKIDEAIAQGKKEIYLTKINVYSKLEYTDFSNFHEEYYPIKIHFRELGSPELKNK